MKSGRFIFFCILINLLSGILVNAEASDPDLKEKLNIILTNWKAVKAETLHLPQNADMIEELKVMA